MFFCEPRILISSTPLILLKHLHRHVILQLSHHLDGPFTLMADMLDRPQKYKRHCAVIVFFPVPGNHQDGVSTSGVMHQVLPCGQSPGQC
jgi:hypothetical protein